MNSKGQVAQAAKWIFVVIIGVFLLGLFFNMIFKNVEDSKNENERLILSYLNTFITNTRINPNFQIQRDLDKNVQFEVDYNDLLIGKNSRSISDVVLYSPKNFDTKNRTQHPDRSEASTPTNKYNSELRVPNLLILPPDNSKSIYRQPPAIV
mgnify:CR=1 FL=1